MNPNSEGEGTPPIVPASMWRSGPAELLYDMANIPMDPDLGYAEALQQLQPTGNERPPLDEEAQRRQDIAVASLFAGPEKPEQPMDPPVGASASDHHSVFLMEEPDPVLDFQVTNYNDQWEADAAAANLLVEMKRESISRKLKAEQEAQIPDYQRQAQTRRPMSDDDDDGDFNLVAQVEWEKDVVFDSSETPRPISKTKQTFAGWIPTATNRKWEGYTCTNSNFPIENEQLAVGDWEDDIVWDVEDLQEQKPQPKLPVYEEHAMPEDVPPVASTSTSLKEPEPAPSTSRKKAQSNKRSSVSLEKVDPQPLASASSNPSRLPQLGKDFFSLSNDKFYQHVPKAELDLANIGWSYVSSRHSKLVQNLIPPFVKLHCRVDARRHLHRPQLTNERNAPTTTPKDGRHFLKPATLRIQKMAKERSKLINAGMPIFMDQPIDLSARDGELILVENCEECPPFLSLVGMCSKIVNYSQGTSSSHPMKEEVKASPPHPYGETTLVRKLPSQYLGNIGKGEIFSALENNMYSSPIYPHRPPSTDFLIIRNKHGYMVREIDANFTAGQQSPLMEIPDPDTPRMRNFPKSFLRAFLLRKFRSCPEKTPAVRLDDITKFFPDIPVSSIKNRVKFAAEFKQIEGSTWIVKKPSFNLPSEVELREMFSPEHCCAYNSMLVAEQRLKEFGCNSILAFPELMKGVNRGNVDISEETKKSSDHPNEMEISILSVPRNLTMFQEELNMAPWKTTVAFIAACKGKCFLDIEGSADPTGCGEGFSYNRVAKPEQPHRQKYASSSDRTNSMSTKTAAAALRKAGIPEDEINKLNRREMVDAVDILSKEKSKLDKMRNTTEKGRYALSLVRNQSPHLQYQDSCQRVFELQNRILSSEEVLSTDEDADDEEEEGDEEDDEDKPSWAKQADIDRMGENIEKLLTSEEEDINSAQLLHDQEEKERIQLQLEMLGKVKTVDAALLPKSKKAVAAATAQEKEGSKPRSKVLKISRTFLNEDGKMFIRTEIVRDPRVMAAYCKIYQAVEAGGKTVKEFLQNTEQMEKREERERKLAINKTTDVDPGITIEDVERPKKKKAIDEDYVPYSNKKKMKISVAGKKGKGKVGPKGRKCGKCGNYGHIKTNSACPMFNVKSETTCDEPLALQSKSGHDESVSNPSTSPIPSSTTANSSSSEFSSSEDDSETEGPSGNVNGSVSAHNDKENEPLSAFIGDNCSAYNKFGGTPPA